MSAVADAEYMSTSTHEDREPRDEEKTVIVGERSGMTVGLVICIVGLAVSQGYFGGVVSTKLTTVIDNQKDAGLQYLALRDKVTSLEMVADRFEKNGSPVLQRRIEQLEKSMLVLENKFENHAAKP